MRQSYSSVAGVSGALLAALAALVVAMPAMAQEAGAQQAGAQQPPPARYLSWSGKAEMSPAAGQHAAPQGQARYPGLIPRQSAASVQMTPAPVRIASNAPASRYGGNRLTPASAWTGAPATTYASAPEVTPYPTESAYTPAPAPAPMPRPALRPAPQPDALVTTAPAEAPMSAYADAPVPSLQAPQPGFEAAFDPMAPRRDALIFNMGRAEPAPLQAAPQSSAIPAATTVVPTADAAANQVSSQAPAQAAPTAYAANEPARQGARYYSVHRAAGHQPDATVMPVSVYLDTAPVDLAEPPETVLPARNVNGRARNIIPNEDPSLP